MEQLSPQLEGFIRVSIGSVEQLEILLLMKDSKLKEWSCDALSRVIRSRPDSVTTRLQFLSKLGLIAERVDSFGERRYWYEPVSERINELVDLLERAYQNRRYTVINLIYSGKPVGSAPSLEDFADAFHFR
jgi:predicted transcriptional regulator